MKYKSVIVPGMGIQELLRVIEIGYLWWQMPFNVRSIAVSWRLYKLAAGQMASKKLPRYPAINLY